MRWALNGSVAMNGREREASMGRRRAPARRPDRKDCRTEMSGRWLVTIESRPLVTSQKMLREKKAHVSVFSQGYSQPVRARPARGLRRIRHAQQPRARA